MSDQYDDIIHLPHYEPKNHPRMSMWNRAAQFAPFAALTGYGDAIQESGRLTDAWIDKGEYGNEQLNQQMEQLLSHISEHPSVTIQYFVPDSRKSGGSYETLTGRVRTFDDFEKVLIMTDGTQIALDKITHIQL